MQEQLLALRHWLDTMEKQLLALPEPGTALQVTSGLGCDWAIQSQAGLAHVCTEPGDVLVLGREEGILSWLGEPSTQPRNCLVLGLLSGSWCSSAGG